MNGFWSKLDRLIGGVLDLVAFTASLLVVGLMIFLILARYVFGWSLVGTLELVMLAGMWLYMSGALIASRRNEHLVVDFLELQIRDSRIRALHRTLVACIVAVICACFVYWAYRMLAWGMVRPQRTLSWAFRCGSHRPRSWSRASAVSVIPCATLSADCGSSPRPGPQRPWPEKESADGRPVRNPAAGGSDGARGADCLVLRRGAGVSGAGL
ncbi:TRAP transporter small permease [Halomonas sp. E19]|uniref:TRAP transporter small permease n=1 Tax=Halomonas sp. E19 TaxID=3397247 RepID=UPI004034807D